MVKTKKEEETKEVEVTIPVELDDYIKEKIDKEVNIAVSKAEKKLLKSKNISIFKRDILIVILIFFYVLLGYNLYNTNYFDKFLSKYIRTNSNEIANKDNTNQKESKESTLENTKEIIDKEKLINKYTPLIKKISFYEDSSNIKDFFAGEFTDDVKEEIVFNSLKNNDFEKSSKVISIDSSKIKEIGESYFTSFNLKDFNYNGVKVHYMEDLNSFVLVDNPLKEKNLISSQIIDVKEKKEEHKLNISVVHFVIKDNKLYNPESMEEIEGYKENKDINEFKDVLPKLIYIFDINDGGIYKLDKISKNMEE